MLEKINLFKIFNIGIRENKSTYILFYVSLAECGNRFWSGNNKYDDKDGVLGTSSRNTFGNI